MKRIFCTLLSAALLLCNTALCGCSAKKAEVFTLPEEYTLAFSEEFENGYDENVWNATEFTPRKGGYWSSEQVFCKDGNLVIRTEYKDDSRGSGYYTGEMSWNNLRSTYGYYEIRCKVDNIRGAWSAFWLMPDDISKTEQKAQDGAEIDIFESALPYRVQNTLHYDGYTGSKKKVTKLDDVYDGFHTFALDWKKDSLRFYYDNKLLWEVTDPDLISTYPVYMDISTEVNGDLKDGEPVPNRWFWFGCGKIDNKNNKMPSDFVIDYVRVYDNGDLIWSEKENNN